MLANRAAPGATSGTLSSGDAAYTEVAQAPFGTKGGSPPRLILDAPSRNLQ
jgi:hypothetical protein